MTAERVCGWFLARIRGLHGLGANVAEQFMRILVDEAYRGDAWVKQQDYGGAQLRIEVTVRRSPRVEVWE